MVSFLAFGDFGFDTPITHLMRNLLFKSQEDITAVISLGDNFYFNGIKSVDDRRWTEWENNYKKLKCPFYAILGNHDYLGDYMAQIEYSNTRNTKWTMPFRYYEKKFYFPDKTDGVHVFFTDSMTLCPNTSRSFSVDIQNIDIKQWEWLEEGLSKSDMMWKIVVGHYPVFSNGMHGNTEELQTNLVRLLEKYNVDFYLSGHDHNLECIAHNGIHYIISGTGCSSNQVVPKKDTLYASREGQYGYSVLKFYTTHAIFGFTTNQGNFQKILLPRDKHVKYNFL